MGEDGGVTESINKAHLVGEINADRVDERADPHNVFRRVHLICVSYNSQKLLLARGVLHVGTSSTSAAAAANTGNDTSAAAAAAATAATATATATATAATYGSSSPFVLVNNQDGGLDADEGFTVVITAVIRVQNSEDLATFFRLHLEVFAVFVHTVD
jgi:hypothetical protein